MKAVNIAQVEGGFIVTTITDGQQYVSVAPNLGRATKVARALFGEDPPSNLHDALIFGGLSTLTEVVDSPSDRDVADVEVVSEAPVMRRGRPVKAA